MEEAEVVDERIVAKREQASKDVRSMVSAGGCGRFKRMEVSVKRFGAKC